MRGVKTWLTRPIPVWPFRSCAVGNDDAGRFLPAMLLRKEALIADLAGASGVPQMPNRPHFSFFSYSSY